MSKQHITSYISQIFGKFANREFSKPIQTLINKGYVTFMGLDMSEFDTPNSYTTLNKLFTREFKTPREINPKYTLISPVDALISDCGKIKDGYAYQIKGMEYKLDELLGKQYTGFDKLLEDGEFINFYLSPKDYHRYHIPMDLEVLSLSHIPGKLYPVNNRYLNKKKNLFIENERVVIKVKDRKDKIHFLILVGALNVGQMVVTFEERVITNAKIQEESYYEYSDLKLKIGELFGYFKMGSTIVMLSQKDAIIPDVKAGKSVKFGERIGALL
ncbi:Phosphatidylserine decarboxylase [hydrothermal vent metagenome]|uniref:phosphatidylserine decarboxylase n=1 Tax=hydrothermal vent metagenome TaxID=652676 RepID=A0A1W1EIV0_9ZZZZ